MTDGDDLVTTTPGTMGKLSGRLSFCCLQIPSS
jgi:hypothetical protein